jgi:sugar/nucleoside kinase (ribokinase family)
MDVVTFGETMVLFAAVEQGPLRFASTYTRHTAGTESNFAIGLARLGHEVGWFSRVGDDEFGQYIVNTVRGEGVDTSRVIVDAEAPTGVLFKEKRELGPRRIVYYRRGSAASRLAPGDLDGEYIGRARYLHLTGITPALSESARATVFAAAELARARGVRVSFDPNLRLRLWTREQARETMRALLPLCDLVLPGMDEAELLVDEAENRAKGIVEEARAQAAELVAAAEVVLQATTLTAGGEPVPGQDRLRPGVRVLDCNYGPASQGLVTAARAAGAAAAADGLGMLCAQAAGAVAKIARVRPDLEAMAAAVGLPWPAPA